MTSASSGPEALARENIDAALREAGWEVQDHGEMNLYAGNGVAVREFPMKPKHGKADYLLYVDQEPVGVLEAKRRGETLTGVEVQADKYSKGLPETLTPPINPLPFQYISTGVETVFWSGLDPYPKSRRLFHFHRPEALVEWMQAPPLESWVTAWAGKEVAEQLAIGGLYGEKPSSFRSRLQQMPPVDLPGLWPNKITAITNLEQSFKEDHSRALIQMATGSGKTKLAITAAYRLIKFAGARRILFLVDRSNLGEQAEKEFQSFITPDENRKFTELYNVQRLTSNKIGSSSKVVITTIQRLYSMLKGEEELDEELEGGSQFDTTGQPISEPVPVAYNSAIPVEFFDVIVIDECHRSIYSLWRQVIEYFDAYLVGLTATPAKHTFGFFNQNLVMEYSHEDAVADGVNVDFEIYKIRTKITEEGSTIEAEPDTVVGVRDKKTRKVRWEKPDEDIAYEAKDLDKNVVAKDQIRLIAKTFKERLPTEIFPGRKEVPKTIIFAKSDSHADDIVTIFRDVFGKGNEFCQKITYKTTGKSSADLIQDFRNSYNPRIAVTVDMIATGTDIKPVEIVMFMRTVKSRVYFEQMKGRGVRVIEKDELEAVTPDAKLGKDHFILVDCVGLAETDLADTQPLERKKSVSFKALLKHVAEGGTDPELLSSLASRLARLERQCGPEERKQIKAVADDIQLSDITHSVIRALDPDEQLQAARAKFDIPEDEEPTEEQQEAARQELCREAVKPLAANPDLRNLLLVLKQHFDQIIDEISQDELLHAGTSEEAKEKAKNLVQSFESFLDENKDEIEALQFFYSQPYSKRLHYSDIKQLAETIKLPPRSWTPEKLWRAYETLDKSRVQGSAQRVLTDVVSLVRFALHQEDELAPFADRVQERFDHWMAQQTNQGKQFNAQQVRWLEMIRDHIAGSLEIDFEDFRFTPFVEQGGLGRAMEVFGQELQQVLQELNQELAA